MIAAEYSAWSNVTTNAKNVQVVSGEVRDRCPHCFNLGLVVIDDSPEWRTTGVPCPMCALGGVRSVEYAAGRVAPMGSHGDQPAASTWTGEDGRHFWHGADLAQLSWNGGMTIRHTRICATIGCGAVADSSARCDTHSPTADAWQVPA